MNFIHISLNGPYTEGWAYQENIIAKYHARQGHNVTIIASNLRHLDSGDIVETDSENYVNGDGVRVIRLKRKKCKIPLYSEVFAPFDIYHLLCQLNPDIIMVHGLIGSTSALQVRRYIKRVGADCRAVVDIHQDIYNSPIKNSIKRRVLTAVHRVLNGKMYPIYQKIFYVAPSTGEFAKEYYNAPFEKLELLPLGCDPEYIDITHQKSIREEVRVLYNLAEEDIVLCHGGKLNDAKKTAELVSAFSRLSDKDDRLKLILFGSISDDYKNRVFPSDIPNNILFTGMLTPAAYYRVYLASDLAVFPGSQSALWQQAIACGVGTVVNAFPHTKYLDLGGNMAYFDGNTSDKIYDKLHEIIVKQTYVSMKQVAIGKGFSFFSYDRIAQRVVSAALGKE